MRQWRRCLALVSLGLTLVAGIAAAATVAGAAPDEAATAQAEPTPPPPPPPPPPPASREPVTLEFNVGSARLSNVARARLDEVWWQMKQDPDLRARVVGFADASEHDANPQRLSEERAEAAKNFLVIRHGLDPARITTEGQGSSDRGRVALVYVSEV